MQLTMIWRSVAGAETAAAEEEEAGVAVEMVVEVAVTIIYRFT